MLLWVWFLWLHAAAAVRHIKTLSLLTCMDNSQFTATNFDVIFYPGNNTIYIDVLALSLIAENTFMEAEVNLIVYGFNVLNKNFSFCSFNQKQICPFQPGHIDLQNTKIEVLKDVTRQIPGIAYTVPDLDARVRVLFRSNTSLEVLACVEAVLLNGKSVQTKYASWPIAAVSGVGVITSWLVGLFGYSSTAAHIALNSLSLFVYFQLVALVSMQAVARAPPIACAWAQNFMWSVGIMKVGFMQDVANWYVQLTGGTASDILDSAGLRLSISVQKKRDSSYYDQLSQLYQKAIKKDHLTLFKRFSLVMDKDRYTYDYSSGLYSTDEKDPNLASKILVLRGMQRVAYLAGIEITLFFMTLIMFLLFVLFCMLVIWFILHQIMLISRYAQKRKGKNVDHNPLFSLVSLWPEVIKGSLYRLFIVSLPQIIVMCVWQFFERDSAGTIVFAAILLFCWLLTLIYAVVMVFIQGIKSIREMGNPAAKLYSDLKFLLKFGFIYTQFRADRFWWTGISLFYIIFKGLMIACLQNHGKAGALIVFITEFFYLIGICVIRPYMDTPTNAFNIVLAIINFLNAFFFAFFSNIFTQPAAVSSIMGIIFFILNAVVALVLLLWTCITCLIALLSRNSDGRYRPTKDDRASFLNPMYAKRRLGLIFTKHKGDELQNLGQTVMKNEPENAQYRDLDLLADVDLVWMKLKAQEYRQRPHSYVTPDGSLATFVFGTDSLLPPRHSQPSDEYIQQPLSTIGGLSYNDGYPSTRYPHQAASTSATATANNGSYAGANSGSNSGSSTGYNSAFANTATNTTGGAVDNSHNDYGYLLTNTYQPPTNGGYLLGTNAYQQETTYLNNQRYNNEGPHVPGFDFSH